MAESIMFLTGGALSPENPVAITPGTAVAAFSAAEQASKHRTWALTAAAGPANLPVNHYRGFLLVDNSESTEDAVVTVNGVTVQTVKAGGKTEWWRKQGHIGPEAMVITMAGTTANACVVQERGFI